MDNGHRERQTLTDAHRQARSPIAGILLEFEALQEIGNAFLCLFLRQMEEMGMQFQVLHDRQLGIEGKGLRHISDAVAQVDVAGVNRLPKKKRVPRGRGQQTSEHFHGRGFAAAIRADEAENFAARDGEGDVVYSSKIAEFAGKPLRDNSGRTGLRLSRRYFNCPVTGAQRFGEKADERIFDVIRPGLRLDRRRRARGKHLSVIHGNEPVEEFGLFHIGGRHQNAHSRLAHPHPPDQLPELPPGQGIDARCWFVKDQKLGIVDQGAAESKLLAHPTRKLFRRPIREGRQPGTLQKVCDPKVPFPGRLAE